MWRFSGFPRQPHRRRLQPLDPVVDDLNDFAVGPSAPTRRVTGQPSSRVKASSSIMSSVRKTTAEITRKSTSPAANKAPNFGKRSASANPYRNWPAARPRLIPCVVASSAATCSQPSTVPLLALVGVLLSQPPLIELAPRRRTCARWPPTPAARRHASRPPGPRRRGRTARPDDPAAATIEHSFDYGSVRPTPRPPTGRADLWTNCSTVDNRLSHHEIACSGQLRHLLPLSRSTDVHCLLSGHRGAGWVCQS